MPQSAVTTRFSVDPLLPLYGERFALELPVNLAPGTTLAAGTVLGQITSSADDKQTFTATGTPTGGSFTFIVTNPITGATANLVIPYNATSAALKTLADAIFGVGNTVAGGGAWPGTALTLTGAGALANTPIPVAVASTNGLTGGTTPAATVAHTVVGRTANTFAAYASGNSDGSQLACAILKYNCAVDASGRITVGTTSVGGFFGETRPDAPAYFLGVFDASKLVGLDANALGLAGWSVLTGTAAAPVIVAKF
jgi:hypothetical protein